MPSHLIRRKGGMSLMSYYHEAGCRSVCHQSGLWCSVAEAMATGIWLCALCRECLWDNLGILLKERGRYVVSLCGPLGLVSHHPSLRVEGPPHVWLHLSWSLSLQAVSFKKRKGSSVLAFQCSQQFITQNEGEHSQSWILESCGIHKYP